MNCSAALGKKCSVGSPTASGCTISPRNCWNCSAIESGLAGAKADIAQAGYDAAYPSTNATLYLSPAAFGVKVMVFSVALMAGAFPTRGARRLAARGARPWRGSRTWRRRETATDARGWTRMDQLNSIRVHLRLSVARSSAARARKASRGRRAFPSARDRWAAPRTRSSQRRGRTRCGRRRVSRAPRPTNLTPPMNRS